MTHIRINRLIGSIMPDDFTTAIRKHIACHGNFPHILAPTTFNEKICCRKIFDRRSIQTECADKYRVRHYVQAKVGSWILPELYHLTNDPTKIPFDDLPNQYAVKPTHGSGWVRLVRDNSSLDRTELVEICKSWLSQSYYRKTRQWCYKNIVPRIIVEELIHGRDGSVPLDYKFYVFRGSIELIQVDINRFTDHRRNLYDRSWNRLDAMYGYPQSTEEIERPPHLDQMLDAAQKLGEQMEFVRVDLYDTNTRIYFGELTNTPENGLARFVPSELDTWLGTLWKEIPIWRLVLAGAFDWLWRELPVAMGR